MSTVEDLIPLIYHERQEPGSMLCAQHALNSLLQENLFNAPALSDIAQKLDEEEAQYDDSHGHTSMNMDDTGFFSVQVLERALQVWGLTLVRWRSEAMRPFQDYPHSQLAFILNLEQHWYTLRRFPMIPQDPFIDASAVVGHWFNLNSSLQAPEWISKTYLGMVLQQAETEGYSVFAVTQLDPNAPLTLPPSRADHLAITIPERGSATQSSASRNAFQVSHVEGFENEDMELQAALQASLMGGVFQSPPTPSSAPPRASTSAPGVLTPTQRHYNNAAAPPLVEEDDDDDVQELDPVAASMARSRAFMQQMQRAQEAALREGYEEEAARVEMSARRPRAPAEEHDEDELLRRAIAESQAEARARETRAVISGAQEDDEDEELDDPDYEPPVVPPRIPPPSASAYDPYRVYDDEDAELQAALKASLESVPEGFRVPDTPPRLAPRPLPDASTSIPPPSTIQRQASSASESESSIETETESEAEQPQVEQLSMEEIRRRRLARFGG